MAVVFRDALEGGGDAVGRSLQQLEIEVVAADQRAGDAVALVPAARVGEDAVEHALVITEGARGIDDLKQ
jgi:hypothetical protein